MQKSSSFKPSLGQDPEILILGTLPSAISLKKQEYYGHPRNQFWPLIYALFGHELDTDYNTRISFAKTHGIALWDVCKVAIRPGSLDSAIKEEEANAINELLYTYPSIQIVAFNGQKAEKLYQKYLEYHKGASYVTLLSSSPANAAYSYTEKLKQWQTALSTNG